MANHGPPTGGGPDAWRSGEAYGPPEQAAGPGGPWPGYPYPGDERNPGRPGAAYPETAAPTSGYPAGAGQPGIPSYPVIPYQSGGPGPPRRHRSRGPLIAVAVIFTVFVVGGVSTLFLLRQRAEEASVTSATEAPPSPAPPTGTPEPGGAAPESSADPRFVKVGQCVRNDGPLGGQPKLAITECGPKTYEVLRRFDGATSGEKDAEAKCARVEGYTNWYFFDSELDTLDFVLCLKLR